MCPAELPFCTPPSSLQGLSWEGLSRAETSCPSGGAAVVCGVWVALDSPRAPALRGPYASAVSMCAENVSGWVGCVWGSVTDCVTRRCFLCGCKRQNTWSLNVLCVTGNPRDAASTDHFPGWEGGVCALGRKKKKSKKKGNRGGWDGVRALPVSSRVGRRASGRLSAATQSSLAARCVSAVLTGVSFLPRQRQRAFGGAFCSSTVKSGPQLGSRSLSSYHATCGIRWPPRHPGPATRSPSPCFDL